jgi:pimeloyl-ACP methyl ester carboxylesterase
LTGIRALAQLYNNAIDKLDLREVTIIGNSIGGWPFRVDPATMTPEAQAVAAGNRAALAAYAGESMSDPTLAARLSGLTVPTLVLWGSSDHIVDADYGRAYAEAIPGAHFELLTETGHSPQLETPAQVLKALDDKARHSPGAAS